MSGDAFADRVAALDREDRAALVAAVYDARGWAVDREGAAVVATPPGGGEPRRLAVTAEGTTVATRPDDTSLDAADLRELLTYALDTADRERLCRRFFDRDPDDLLSGGERDVTVDDAVGEEDGDGEVDSDGDGSDDTDDAPDGAVAVDDTVGEEDGDGDDDVAADEGADDSVTVDEAGSDDATDEGGPRVRYALLVGVAVALVVGSIGAVTGPTLAPGADADADAGGGNTTAVGNGTTEASFPPGVDDDGITSAISVAGAHAEVLSGRSYRIHILHREYVDGRLRGVVEERIAVERSDRYRSRVRVVGTVEHTEPLIEEESVYADGTARYVRPVEGLEPSEREREIRRTTREPTGPNRVVDRSRRYVRWYLGVEESRVTGRTTRDGRTEIRVGLEGDSWPGSRDVVGEARIDERGLVRVVRRASTPLGEPSVRVVVTIRVTLEPVTVTRPAWADRDADGTTPTPTARANATERRVEP